MTGYSGGIGNVEPDDSAELTTTTDDIALQESTEELVGPEPDFDDGRSWNEDQWKTLVQRLIEYGLVDWRGVASAVLGQFNPPQVGTSLATTNPGIKAQYPKGQRMAAVMAWFYEQEGKCQNCGTRLDLQVDHIDPKELGGQDSLDNFQLLCRRCNTAKRPSHKKGGLTPLSAAPALMWLLIHYQPSSRAEFYTLCRRYGLSMASIRFDEAWARAAWLTREGKYPLDGV